MVNLIRVNIDWIIENDECKIIFDKQGALQKIALYLVDKSTIYLSFDAVQSLNQITVTLSWYLEQQNQFVQTSLRLTSTKLTSHMHACTRHITCIKIMIIHITVSSYLKNGKFSWIWFPQLIFTLVKSLKINACPLHEINQAAYFKFVKDLYNYLSIQLFKGYWFNRFDKIPIWHFKEGENKTIKYCHEGAHLFCQAFEQCLHSINDRKMIVNKLCKA